MITLELHAKDYIAMELFRGMRNTLYLVSDGYVYTKMRRFKNSETWQCSSRFAYTCSAQLVTVGHDQEGIKSQSHHSHDPDPHALANLRIRKELFDTAKSTGRSVKAGEIVDGVSAGYSPAEMAAAGSDRQLQDIIRREKFKSHYIILPLNHIL